MLSDINVVCSLQSNKNICEYNMKIYFYTKTALFGEEKNQ